MKNAYDEILRYSADGMIHDKERLAELQALPLHKKIGITIARITEFYNHFNGNVYVSLSGGKDSTVLWDIVHKLFPDVPAVFSNTGLEYPEIQQFAKSICTDVVTPKMPFTEVIKTYGYPIISKEVSEAVYYARRNTTPPVQRDNMEETGAYRRAPANKSQRVLASNTPPISRTHSSTEAIRAAWRKKRLVSDRRMFGERCLWVAWQVRTALKNLYTTKRNGCLWFIFRSKSRITVAM